MGGHADHRYVGPRWERAPSLGPDLIRDTSEKVSLIQQASSHSSEPGKRAMQMYDVDP